MTLEILQEENGLFGSPGRNSFIERPRRLSSLSKENGLNISSYENPPNRAYKDLVGEALRSRIETVNHDECEAGMEDSFFVCDLGEVYRSFKEWQRQLPMVRPFYAVKCNGSPEVVKLFARLGAGFDCASKSEIDNVLSYGVSPQRIVYANPCKTTSYIRHAEKVGVNLTTVDNSQELIKLSKFHPGTEILIRLATDDETAQCRLSTKFGCSVDDAINTLLPLAAKLNLNVVGIAFHVGSGAKDFDSIYKAIRDSRFVFDKATNKFGFSMKLLDIGGGFEIETFERSSVMVRLSLNEFFPPEYVASHPVDFIAEPGRFMVANAFTLATHVIARRDIADHLKKSNDVEAMLYINDGVYANLSCIIFDHQHPMASVLIHKGKFCYKNGAAPKGKHHFSIWGPTCDGLDCVSERTALSHNVQVGDWLSFPNLGAYTTASATNFNGFSNAAEIIYVSTENITEVPSFK